MQHDVATTCFHLIPSETLAQNIEHLAWRFFFLGGSIHTARSDSQPERWSPAQPRTAAVRDEGYSLASNASSSIGTSSCIAPIDGTCGRRPS